MKLFKWLLLVLAVASVNLEQVCPQSQNAQTASSITVNTLQQSFKLGSEIDLEITLTNTSGKTRSIYWPVDNLVEDDFEYKIMVLDQAGKMPVRTRIGRNVIDHDAGINIGHAHVLPHRDLKDGEMVKEKLDLTRYFVFQPGKYTVQLQLQWGNETPKSNTLSFVVNGGQ